VILKYNTHTVGKVPEKYDKINNNIKKPEEKTIMKIMTHIYDISVLNNISMI